ncbi:MAG: endo alpha-1,4 polygalactosaminidase [Spirochaetaceae bacterium]|jgi:cysteinyl-tRNA synthetase|nr:endo alpha-1,4 polygalactosaminidase [Spirochaetaceae bacterium]
MARKSSFLILAILTLFLFSCSSIDDQLENTKINYRREMRNFVQIISEYGRSHRDNFIIIPQNGQELLTLDGIYDGPLALEYINAIDGVGREDLFYGYSGDNRSTPEDAFQFMLPYLILSEKNGIEVLVIDYCSAESRMTRSYVENEKKGFISFAADHRGLDNIPEYPEEPWNVNNRDIKSLSDAANFLYLINPEEYSTVEQMISSINTTNYDLLIIDLFDNMGNILSSDQIERLKTKADGGKRLVIAYMSIGEAEDYRFYWKNDWEKNPPLWMDRENPHWKGNYKVRYWEPSWQELILGKEDAYLDKILKTGFDGVYLDIIDAFDYFEFK